MLDKIIWVGIAILQNVFVHHIASISFKNLPYTEKQDKITSMLFILGILSITIGKLVIGDKKLVSNGLTLGGILLLLTILLINWRYLSDKVKLVIFGSCFISILWYAYKKNKTSKSNKKNSEEVADIKVSDIDVSDIEVSNIKDSLDNSEKFEFDLVNSQDYNTEN